MENKIDINLGQTISDETSKLAKELGFNWPIDTQSQLQKWLRENHNHNIVPVRVPSQYDNHDNHKIYLNGREWYCGGTFVVEAGYEKCLEAGLKKSILFLLDKKEHYESIKHDG